jgi:hypothetical protein
MLLRSQVEQVLGEALGRTERLVAPDYHRRRKVEVLCFIPVIGKILLVNWWLKALDHWVGQLTGNEILDTIDMLLQKNHIYGSKQLYAFGSLGILIRSYDKVQRIKNIDGGASNQLLAEEGRKDSVKDLFGYAILAVLVLRKEL